MREARVYGDAVSTSLGPSDALFSTLSRGSTALRRLTAPRSDCRDRRGTSQETFPRGNRLLNGVVREGPVMLGTVGGRCSLKYG